MEELLASQSQIPLQVQRGQEVEGEIVSINDKELTLDLGAKSEGVIPARDLNSKQTLKVGDKIKAYVVSPESDSGQIILSIFKQAPKQSSDRLRGYNPIWDKFISAKNKNTPLSGKIREINKGGLIVEADGIRGFLPSSLIGSLTAQPEMEVKVKVSEVDQGNNRLIFTQKGLSDDVTKQSLKEFKSGQKVKGKIVHILPFGLVIDLGVMGIAFAGEVSWERVEDLSGQFKVGQEIEAQVLGVDEELGRLNLSVRALSEDPFNQKASKYKSEDTVKGTVTQVTPNGVVVLLEDNVEGLLPSSKLAGGNYQVGESITALVDSVDKLRRRVNLSPFITSTSGLIYK